MNKFFSLILFVLIFLALSSGLTKILLMQQEVDFFGQYGFTKPLLVAFAVAQILGGLLMIATKTRFFGAALVTITFLISAVLLVMERNTVVAIITLVATSLLALVMKRSFASSKTPQP